MLAQRSTRPSRAQPAPARRSRKTSSALSCTHRLLRLSPQKRVRVSLVTKCTEAITQSHSEMVSAPTPQLRLPRVLPKPVFNEVDMAPIAEAYPELSNVTPEYIRGCLPVKGAEMLAAVANFQAQSPGTALPTELEIVMNDIVAAACPTLMLAVYSSSASTVPHRRKVTLFPAHHLVLASHCSKLPPIPHLQSNHDSSRVTLPVVPLCLPSPETFPTLQSFLYTKNTNALLTALLPSSPDGLPFPKVAPSTLFRHAMIVNGVWRNACALGVIDDDLFDAISIAWEAILSGLGTFA